MSKILETLIVAKKKPAQRSEFVWTGHGVCKCERRHLLDASEREFFRAGHCRGTVTGYPLPHVSVFESEAFVCCSLELFSHVF